MASTLNYKCPFCGGADVIFDSTTQKMRCSYCKNVFDIDKLTSDNSMPNGEGSEGDNSNSWNDEDKSVLRTYICSSCGGEIIAGKDAITSSCPFCGSHVTLTDNLSGDYKPDLIIPFKLDKEEAKRRLSLHMKGKHLLSKAFSSNHHIDKITAVYTPFWLFDATAHASIDFTGVNTTTWSDDDYDYIKSDYYDIYTKGRLSFAHIAACATSKIPLSYMESIEPFDFSKAVPFKTAYLAGYLAERYNIDTGSCLSREMKRIKSSTTSAISSTIREYMSVYANRANIKLAECTAYYALYPVWLLSTSYKGKKYLFAMNGQSGKFVGDLPVSKARAAFYFITTFLLACIVLTLILLVLYFALSRS